MFVHLQPESTSHDWLPGKGLFESTFGEDQPWHDAEVSLEEMCAYVTDKCSQRKSMKCLDVALMLCIDTSRKNSLSSFLLLLSSLSLSSPAAFLNLI